MLATQSTLKCCLNGSYKCVPDQEIMVDGKPVIVTLKDNISSELLESKIDEAKAPSGSSSVELWIKSLSNSNDTEDSRSDHNTCIDSCSDVDDLQLGAEATDLSLLMKKRNTTSRSDYSASDSDENRSFSKSRKYLFARHKSYERSLDSDISARSSTTSVSSLLSARESDPEEVLKAAGFGGTCVIDCIPDRFVATGTICQGVNAEQFLNSIQKDEDKSSNAVTSGLPPWIMARADDIPKKFLLSNDQTSANDDIVEPASDEPHQDHGVTNHGRASKSGALCSKFGTYLEPVTEELEVSSQGTVNLTVGSPRDFSFDSNRSSTLKADSRDDSIENGNKIPSLRDLWSSGPPDLGGDDDFESADDVIDEATPAVDYSLAQRDRIRDVVNIDENCDTSDKSNERIPGLMSYYSNENEPEPPVSFECENFDTEKYLRSCDEDNSLSSRTEPSHVSGAQLNNPETCPYYASGLTDYLTRDSELVKDTESLPANKHLSKVLDKGFPSDSASSHKLNDNNIVQPSSTQDSTLKRTQDFSLTLERGQNSAVLFELQPESVKNSTFVESVLKPWSIKSSKMSHEDNALVRESRQECSHGKPPTKTIPSIIISSSNGSQRNPTSSAPAVDPTDYRLLQPELFEDTLFTMSEENEVPGVRGRPKTNTVTVNNRSQMSYLITSNGKCVCIRSKLQSQISLSSNVQENFRPVKRHEKNVKVATMKRTRFPSQIVSEKSPSKKIQCFSMVNTVRKTGSRNPSLLRCQRSSGFCSLATQSDHATELTSENGGHTLDVSQQHGQKVEHHCEGEGKGFCHCGQVEKDSPTSLVSLWKTNNEEVFKNGKAIDEELDGLKISLKGIKIYKAGIHLMQLASSIETVMGSETTRPVGPLRSCQILLDSIQKELKDSENYILHLQKRLLKLKNQKVDSPNEDTPHEGSDFSEMTSQLLREQLKMFTSITSSVSPTSTPSRCLSTDDSSLQSAEDLSRYQNDMGKLRSEVQIMRQENENLHSTLKKELLSEMKTEIRNCFKEFVQR